MVLSATSIPSWKLLSHGCSPNRESNEARAVRRRVEATTRADFSFSSQHRLLQHPVHHSPLALTGLSSPHSSSTPHSLARHFLLPHHPFSATILDPFLPRTPWLLSLPYLSRPLNDERSPQHQRPKSPANLPKAGTSRPRPHQPLRIPRAGSREGTRVCEGAREDVLG